MGEKRNRFLRDEIFQLCPAGKGCLPQERPLGCSGVGAAGRVGWGEGMEVGMRRAAWAGSSPAPPHLSPLLLLPQLQKEQRELWWEQKFLSEMKAEHICEQGAGWRKGRDSAHVVGIPARVLLKRFGE